MGMPRLFAFGLLVLAAGTTALALMLHWHRPLAETLSAMLVAASGAGLINAQVSSALIASGPSAQAGMTSSFSSTLRQIGFALGIALLSQLRAADRRRCIRLGFLRCSIRGSSGAFAILAA